MNLILGQKQIFKIYKFLNRKKLLVLTLSFICLVLIEINTESSSYLIYERKGYKPILKNKSFNSFRLSSCYSPFDLTKNFSSSSSLSSSSSASLSSSSSLLLSSLNVDPNSSTMMMNSHPSCDEKDWVLIQDNGTLIYNNAYLIEKNLTIDYCEYSVVKWSKDDFSYEVKYRVRIQNGDDLNKNEEFFHVYCKSTNGFYYVSAFSRIFQSFKTNNSSSSSGSSSSNHNKKTPQPINVFMLGLDSISRENWLSKLTKSSEYLIRELKSNVLNGYNIFGDGTPASLIPLLTSKHEHELPNTIKNTPNFNYVDEAYPFIWRNFSELLDYATLFAEDWPSIGTFQYRMVGMKEKPTNHYMRPFHLSIMQEGISSINSKPCLNGRTNFQVNIKYAEDFMRIYKNRGFFGLMFLNEYSHESNDNLGWIDNELLTFLHRFNTDKSLSDNTILILFADHGARFSNIRKSIKGLLQERNPFFSIYLPQLFKQRYPTQTNNLKHNLNKITTPMDIHKTLLDLISLQMLTTDNNRKRSKRMDLSDDNNPRSISLFDRISSKRNCADAGIEPHWCACLKRSELVIDSFLIDMAKTFLDYVNNVLLKNHLNVCHKLELDKVNSVFLLDSYISLSKIKIEKNLLSLNLLQPPKVEKDYEQYFFQITTKPNMAIYEFTIIVEANLKLNIRNSADFLKEIDIDEKSISRINKYGNSSFCISKSFPDLRKYCYCKSLY